MSKTPIARVLSRTAGGRVPVDDRTRAEKAAATRKANQAAAAGRPVYQPAAEPELTLHLTVTEAAGRLTLALGTDDGDLPPACGWQVVASLNNGRLIGHDTVRISLLDADAAMVADAAAELDQLQTGILADRQASDDSSFARVVSFVAAQYQVVSIHLQTADGKSTEIRRGESYFKLHQFAEQFAQKQQHVRPAA